MIRSNETTIKDLLQDREAVERAFIAAAREVVRVHRSFGESVITADEFGQCKEVSVDDFEQQVNEREAELNRQFGRVPPEQA